MANYAPIHVLDPYYLAITLLITIGYQLVGFSIAFTFKFDKLTDFMGGTNFVWLAIITLSMSGTTHARQIITSIFIMLWGARLSGFLLFRILKTGKDDRFDDKRDKFFPFLGFWVFQMLWVWVVSFPVTILNSPAVLQYPQPSFGKATDIIGVIFFVLAFFLEAISDIQKYRFKQGPGKEPGAVCDGGFFKWSRHPNYFGEIMERPGAKKRYEKGVGWPAYEKYLHDTSILFPMPPAIWSRLPTIVKRTIGFEFPMYVFDPAKHADQDKVQEREAEEGERENN
nr:hypothetical protein CFP56_66120 [Quercus suber]